MKLLSITVPCYNAEAYMRKCIDSLLPGGDEVEILLVDDGSTDGTAAIADEYAENYPDIVRAIHQENRGHGGAVNTGIANATGLYFKVVDSDDWVDGDAYAAVLNTLRDWAGSDRGADLLVSNYVYEKVGKKHKTVIRYTGTLPENQRLTWPEIGKFRIGHYILMHAIIYRRQMLVDCGMTLPQNTFYVDNLYAYIPLRSVESLYYLNVDFYRYFIGREGQSVQEQVMIRRIDQQIRVNKLMIDQLQLDEIPDRNQREYMFNYLEIVTLVSSVLLLRSGTEENYQKKRELWQYIKERNPKLYRKLRRGFLGSLVHLPGRTGRRISVTAYRVTQKVVGFN